MDTSTSPKDDGESGASPLLPSSTSQYITPKPPEGLASDVQEQIASEVMALAATIGNSLGSRTFMMTMENMGRSDQDLATQRIELIETRVNAVTKRNVAQEDIPAAVKEIRFVIDKLNPKRTQQSRVGRILELVPGGRPVLEFWWSSGLHQIAMRRETIREQIKGVKAGLLGNKAQLVEDNRQLNQLYDYIVKGAMLHLQRTAYTCELLLGKLQEMFDGMAPDDPHRGRLQGAIEKITVRVRHMRQTENALQQGLATIDITVDGNGKIAESLEETATLTTAYLTVAMALYQALAHQQQAIQTLVKAREGTADVMIKTSEMAKQGAEKVTELYFDPANELAKVEEAQGNLMSALQTLENASRNGVVKARQSIEKLRSMTEALRDKQAQLRASQALSETQAKS
jgi:uncharacterized protein YaaN involved in tellurite resistance